MAPQKSIVREQERQRRRRFKTQSRKGNRTTTAKPEEIVVSDDDDSSAENLVLEVDEEDEGQKRHSHEYGCGLRDDMSDGDDVKSKEHGKHKEKCKGKEGDQACKRVGARVKTDSQETAAKDEQDDGTREGRKRPSNSQTTASLDSNKHTHLSGTSGSQSQNRNNRGKPWGAGVRRTHNVDLGQGDGFRWLNRFPTQAKAKAAAAAFYSASNRAKEMGFGWGPQSDLTAEQEQERLFASAKRRMRETTGIDSAREAFQRFSAAPPLPTARGQGEPIGGESSSEGARNRTSKGKDKATARALRKLGFNPVAELGLLNAGALTHAVVKKQYRKMALRHHPDKVRQRLGQRLRERQKAGGIDRNDASGDSGRGGAIKAQAELAEDQARRKFGRIRDAFEFLITALPK